MIGGMDAREQELELIRRRELLHQEMNEISPPATTPLDPNNPPVPRDPRWEDYFRVKAQMEQVDAELEEVRRRRAAGEP